MVSSSDQGRWCTTGIPSHVRMNRRLYRVLGMRQRCGQARRSCSVSHPFNFQRLRNLSTLLCSSNPALPFGLFVHLTRCICSRAKPCACARMRAYAQISRAGTIKHHPPLQCRPPPSPSPQQSTALGVVGGGHSGRVVSRRAAHSRRALSDAKHVRAGDLTLCAALPFSPHVIVAPRAAATLRSACGRSCRHQPKTGARK